MSSEEQVERTVERCQQQYITEAVQTIVGRRAPIEQTKGMLMFVYGIDADAAFNLLRWQSQQHNVKLRLIAELILEDLLELSQSKAPGRRPTTRRPIQDRGIAHMGSRARQS
jgi:hypothetical protein